MAGSRISVRGLVLTGPQTNTSLRVGVGDAPEPTSLPERGSDACGSAPSIRDIHLVVVVLWWTVQNKCQYPPSIGLQRRPL